jgi:glutamate/tyrosine decarboxylase-like PLP-dependent enzyme
MSFQHYGKSQIASWVENNIEQAKHLHHLVENSDEFESATEPRMSAICIRYKGNSLLPFRGWGHDELTQLHHTVASRIEKEGRFWFATTVLKGKTWFRINPVNIHTTIQTMDELFETLQRCCKDAEEEMSKDK